MEQSGKGRTSFAAFMTEPLNDIGKVVVDSLIFLCYNEKNLIGDLLPSQVM